MGINFLSYLLFHDDLSRIMVLHSHGGVEPDVCTYRRKFKRNEHKGMCWNTKSYYIIKNVVLCSIYGMLYINLCV